MRLKPSSSLWPLGAVVVVVPVHTLYSPLHRGALSLWQAIVYKYQYKEPKKK